MLWYIVPCALMWGIASAFYEPEKGNRTKVLMGIALFVVFACAFTTFQEDSQLNPAELLGKVMIYVLSGFIATLVKDSKN